MESFNKLKVNSFLFTKNFDLCVIKEIYRDEIDILNTVILVRDMDGFEHRIRVGDEHTPNKIMQKRLDLIKKLRNKRLGGKNC